MQQLVLHHFI